ncbi:dTDP-4-dehydrorhamnose reductase [Candidatus Peregrinibacteria bacterium]|nr:dTDP-4-dehydrorhamnose reductase [Candidatus Peregrinibacteria bacterium]
MLLGKNGMLGSMFSRLLQQNHDFEVFAFDRDLDITDEDALDIEFARVRPDFVLNCAAYTNVDLAESTRELAFKINAKGPGFVAAKCKAYGAKLIHFSTDYVFDGSKAGDGYMEGDVHCPINVYGESKLEGEKAIAAEMSDFYIIRTSWLFGPGGKNFVDTMLELGGEVLSGERDSLRVVDDQVGSPTYTFDLAEAVLRGFLLPFLEGGPQLDFGIYHLTNSGKCSWYEFAREIFRFKGMNVALKPISSEEFVRAAKRPKNSVLLSAKIDFGVRGWNVAVCEYLKKYLRG